MTGESLLTPLHKLLVAVLVVTGLVLIIFALAGTASLVLGPRLVGDQGILDEALGSTLPGYSQTEMTAFSPDNTHAHRQIRFRTTIMTAKDKLACQGLVIYHYGIPPGIDVSWDTEACRDGAETIRLARKVLAGASIRHGYALYGAVRSDDVVMVLQRWLDQGLIELDAIPGGENRAYFN